MYMYAHIVLLTFVYFYRSRFKAEDSCDVYTILQWKEQYTEYNVPIIIEL